MENEEIIHIESIARESGSLSVDFYITKGEHTSETYNDTISFDDWVEDIGMMFWDEDERNKSIDEFLYNYNENEIKEYIKKLWL